MRLYTCHITAVTVSLRAERGTEIQSHVVAQDTHEDQFQLHV